nr:N-6 DNA methylase [Candidatus Cloacimonadota bacterium]
FEHSLTDIERLNAEISGEDLDKKQTRRKKEGVFYTPNYITKYIVENTVGTLCTEEKDELEINNIAVDETYFKKTKKAKPVLSKKGEQLIAKLEEYKEWLLSLKILDPACGSGAFLNQALNFLIDEHNFIIDLETDLRKGQYFAFDIDTAVLENNLYGVDINEESVEIAKLSLWLKTAKKGRKLTDLSKHIKCGNSLIDDPEIAGDKAFDWNKEFPEIMQNGGFDVVIGNPPYGAKLLQKEKKYLYNKFVTVEYQIDTYTLFIEQAYNLLRKNGQLGFIIPSTWLTMFYFKNLRKFLIENCAFENLLLFKYQVFDEVTAETSIITLSKKNRNTKNIKINHYYNYFETETKPYKFISQNNWRKCYELGFNLFFDKDKLKIVNKILNDSIELNKIIDVTVGIKPYQTNKGKPKQTKEDVKNRIFDANTKINETFKNYIVGGNITKFLIVPCKTNWLKFGDFLAEPRQSLNFFQTKIMVRQTSDKIISAIDHNGQLSLNNVHNLVLRNDVLKYEVLVCILNSKLMNFYYNFLVPEKGRTFAEVKAVNLKRLPIKLIPETSQQPFIENADLMLSLNKQKQELINKFMHRLETNFEIEKLSNKMKTFYDYDFKSLITELKKKKIKLSLSQQDEWEYYFNKYKDEILKLQKQIDETDKEIDQMVYELYGLTKEEIEIVENG